MSSAASSRAKAEETFKAAYKRRLIKDEYNTQVEKVEHLDAVRSLADADQEDAKDDRQEHQTGYPAYQRSLPSPPKRLDLNA